MSEIITAADFEEACEVEVYEGAVAEMLLGSFFGWRLES